MVGKRVKTGLYLKVHGQSCFGGASVSDRPLILLRSHPKIGDDQVEAANLFLA
jgi:hypothetical protein